MIETVKGNEDGLRIERVLPAPVHEVFAAWTDPESMSGWLSPVGVAEVEADPRVDGSFKVVMVGEGMRIEHSGQYLVVDPPHLLKFTWNSPYTGGASVVTVTLTEEADGTRLVLVHDRLPQDQVESHGAGWGSMLGRLRYRLDRASTQLRADNP